MPVNSSLDVPSTLNAPSTSSAPPSGSHRSGWWTVAAVAVALVAFAAAAVLPAAQPAWAQVTYAVNDTGDAGDFDTSDGLCNTQASGSSGTCTLRAAIEQANALDSGATKEITFTDLSPGTDGTITFTPTSGEFRLEDQAIRIRGDQVGGSGWAEGDPPVVYIDAGNLSGSGANGLDVRAVSDSVSIIAVGIINAPGNGIQLRGSINQTTDTGKVLRYVSIQYCWVGVKRDGTAAGNGSGATLSQGKSGIRITNAQYTIVGNPSLAEGPLPTYSAIYGSGGRNVISGNVAVGNDAQAGSGIIIDNLDGTPPSPSSFPGVSYASNNNYILGNYIGLTPDGTGGLGNGGYGIVVDDRKRDNTDDRTKRETLEITGNVVAANGRGGITMYTMNAYIRGNAFGTTADGSTTLVQPADGTTGITVRNTARAWRNYIGGNQAAAGNLFGGYDVGIEFVKMSAFPTALDYIQYNRFGRSAGGVDLPLGRVAISLATSDSMRIENNVIGNVGDGTEASGAIILDSGTLTDGRDQSITNNFIGVTSQGDAIPINGTALYLRGGRNHTIQGNVIGNASLNGIWREAGNDRRDRSIIQANDIGVAPDGSPAGNGGYGVYVTGGVQGVSVGSSYFTDSTETVADGNRIFFNDAGGVRVDGTETKFISMRGNEIFGNQGLPVDVGPEGLEGADGNDDDDGANELINAPEIVGVQCTSGFSEDTATVDVLHESADEGTSGIAGRPDYGDNGLRLDFYSTSGTLLRTVTYTLEGSAASVTIKGPGICNEFATVMATDVDGNTSEFSDPAVALPVELASLNAAVTGTDATVTWTTTSETNNAGFTIEHRAPEESAWTGVAFVEGAGTTDRVQRYRATVPDLVPGVHAFRLRQKDADGGETLSRTVTAEVRLGARYALTVGPNPVAGQAGIALTLQEGQRVRMDLYDVLGRRVKTIRDEPLSRGTTRTTLNTAGLGSGTYVLHVEGDQFRTTRRLVVVQ